MERKILHVDMDAFFAAVEEMDNPELKGTPVIVGGTGERGVVATANYEARKYGVHSAMPGFMAKQKCPHGNFVRGNHERYREVSKEVFKILYSITDKVQPLSIDEAYLDVTESEMDPIEIGWLIKKRVKTEVGLTISVGISYNKFLAKLASDWNKPDGLFVIRKEDVADLLEPLSVRKVHGLGKKSAEKLNRIGIFTIKDLMKYSKTFLDDYLGSFGGDIYYLIRGVDNRSVKVDRTVKSIGKETTLKKNINDKEEMKEIIKKFCDRISQSLYKRDFRANTVTLKYKTETFQNHSKSRTILHSVKEPDEIYEIGSELINEIEFVEKIRLIGVTVSNFTEGDTEQMSIFTQTVSPIEGHSK
jgi:DNA polymerase-4